MNISRHLNNKYVLFIMTLTDYLMERRITVIEGNISQVPYQQEELKRLSKDVKTAMEIGFNAGHSAEIMLENNPDLNLISFDLGAHPYSLVAKEYIDMKYPGRHTLIIGDSRISIPKFIRDFPGKKFDLLFIDGGHEYEIAKADLENCGHLADKDSIFILDDTVINPDNTMYDYNVGPTRALRELNEKKVLCEVKCIDFRPGRGMSVGRYNLDNL